MTATVFVEISILCNDGSGRIALWLTSGLARRNRRVQTGFTPQQNLSPRGGSLCAPGIIERSRWSHAPISAVRTSIFLALCLVVELVPPDRCRSNQSQPPVTYRRRAEHRHGDWAARQCSPTPPVLPWTKAN